MVFPLGGTVGISGDPCTLRLIAVNSSVTVVGNTTFTSMLDPAITAYDRIVTLSGSISFMSNIATGGGALAPDSSTMNIARNTSVHFYNTVRKWERQYTPL